MPSVKGGTTDYTYVRARAFTSDGTPATPAYNDAGIELWYTRGATGTPTAISPASQTTGGAHTDGGFVHRKNGWVRIDLPDAAVASGVNEVNISGGADDWTLITEPITIVAFDPSADLTTARIGNLDNADAPVSTVDSVADAIKAVTDNLPDSGALTSLLSSISSIFTATTMSMPSTLSDIEADTTAILDDTGTSGVVVNSLGANSVNASALAADAVAEIQAGLATASALATLDSIADAIKAVTDNLPDSGALTTIDSNIDAILADTGTDGVVLAVATLNAIADVVARRTAANIEASANGDALSLDSIYGLLRTALDASRSGTTLTVRKTDDTTLATRTLTTDDTADPVTGVSD